MVVVNAVLAILLELSRAAGVVFSNPLSIVATLLVDCIPAQKMVEPAVFPISNTPPSKVIPKQV